MVSDEFRSVKHHCGYFTDEFLSFQRFIMGGGGIGISQGGNRNFIFNPTVRNGGGVTSAGK